MKTSFTPSFLKKQKQHLLELQDSLLGISRPEIASSGGGDFGDQSNQVYEHETALNSLSKNKHAVRLVVKALHKFDEGTYGVCEICGKQIANTRLEAMPYAELTIDCQARVEREGIRRMDNVNGFGFASEEDALVEEQEAD